MRDNCIQCEKESLIGDGTTTNRLSFVQMCDSSGPITDATQVSCGERHTAVVRLDGTVWACGQNVQGALGDGTTTSRLTCVQMRNLSGVITNAIQVSCGSYYTTVVSSDGTVWACGQNVFGALGDGTTTSRLTCVQMSDSAGVITNATQVSSGGYHCAVVRSNGTVWACGYNLYGQLGDETTTNKYLFVQMRDSSGFITNISEVACGYMHTIVRTANRTVWACGHNGYGSLGNATTTNQSTCVQMRDLYGSVGNVVQVFCGAYHSVIVKENRTIWACGANGDGQLGLGHNNNITTFTSQINPPCRGQMTTYNPIMSVYASFNGIMFISISNTIEIFGVGRNWLGELGVGISGVNFNLIKCVPFNYAYTFSVSQLKSFGYSAKQLRLSGYSLVECFQAGYSISDLCGAGFSMSDLRLLPS